MAFREAGPDEGDGLRDGDMIVEPRREAPRRQLAFAELEGRLTVCSWRDADGPALRTGAWPGSAAPATLHGVVRGWVRRRGVAATKRVRVAPALVEATVCAVRQRRLQQRLLALRATYVTIHNARLRRALREEGRRLRAELRRHQLLD